MEKLSDFAKRYGIDRNAASSYVRRHPELFKQHTQKKGRSILVDEQGIIALEKMYARHIITDHDDSAELEEAKRAYDSVQEEIAELRMQLITIQKEKKEAEYDLIKYKAKYESYEQLLEETKSALEKVENDRLKAVSELHDIKVQAAADSVEMKYLQAENERLKHRNWIQRLFNV